MSPNNPVSLPDEIDDVTAPEALPESESQAGLAAPATVRELTSTIADSRPVVDDWSSTILAEPVSKPLPPPLPQAASRRSIWIRRLTRAGLVASIALLAIVVSRPPPAPQLPSIGELSLHEGQTLRLELAAINGDELPPLTYELVGNVPPLVQLAADTGTLTWPIGESDGGRQHAICVRAAVAGQPERFSEIRFNIQVAETSQPPQFSPAPAVNQLQLEDGIYSLRVQAIDQDLPAGELTYGFSADPDLIGPASIDARTGLFTWQPAAEDYGKTLRLVFRAVKAPTAIAETTVEIAVPDPGQAVEVGEGLSYRRFMPLLARQQPAMETVEAQGHPHHGGLLRQHRYQDVLLLVVEYPNAQAARHALPEYLAHGDLLVPDFVDHAGVRRLFHNNRLIALTIGDDQSFVGSVQSILRQPRKVLVAAQ